MDVIGGEAWYEENLVFVETPPYSQNFEMFGIGDMNYVSNSGSYLIIQVYMVLYFIFANIINFICIRFAR